MYLSPFGFSNSRRALAHLLGQPRRNIHEVPVDHLPPLGAVVTPIAERRRQRETITMHSTRSG
jgi:hypothetical protein